MNILIAEAKRIFHFHARAIAEEGEKRGIIYAWAGYYLQPTLKPNTLAQHLSPTQLDDIAHEQSIICRQLFLGQSKGWIIFIKRCSLYEHFI